MNHNAKILYVCQEVVPYLPDNDISSLCRYLPQAMQERGAEIRIFMPRWGCINERRNQLHEVIRLSGMNLIIDDTDHHGMTEGSKWTYLFCVLQDIPGMIDLMGGNDAVAAKLDRNFNENRYRHDNEPGHHYIYLYNYCDRPWKTQELIKKHTAAQERAAVC